MTTFAAWVAAANVLLLAHTAVNLRLLRRPTSPSHTSEQVCILIPARNEAGAIAEAVRSACAQTSVPNLQVVVLDDASTDDTAAVAVAACDDPRLAVVTSDTEPPPGWLGKPWACQRLADLPATHAADVLVFVDADVVLAPEAVAAALALLRTHNLDLVSPYPAQIAEGVVQQLFQPLLQWSWAATLPLRLAERSPRPSLSAANGQFLMVDAGAYRRAGGHAAVSGEVLEDVALVRAVKRTGGRGGVVDGTNLATCRMYTNTVDLVSGYTKSLWSLFGSPVNAVASALLLTTVYIAPLPCAVISAAAGHPRCAAWWAVAYLAAVVSRLLVARRTRGPLWSTLAHPGAITMLLWLLARSWRGRRAGTLQWKGRVLA
ncbi:MAG: glycosyltransferase [Actinomycetales bacterium]|nr:glycosyltransferase [Actinomycetales bacterium]